MPPVTNRTLRLSRLHVSTALCAFGLVTSLGIAHPALADGSNAVSGLWANLAARQTLFGDMGGLRPWLGNYGVTLSLSETSELLGNISGGIRNGSVYEGLTTATLQVDTGKAFGLQGGTFNASALQIHGRGLASNYTFSLDTPSGIESERATRLWELWYDQSLFGGKADIKIGQQSIDQEFLGSTGAAAFMNTMFGWPAVPSYDLNGGGPAFPLSSLGARLRVAPTGALTVLAGVFDDDPGGDVFGTDAQALDASGTRFSTRDGTLAIAELQYAINQPPASGAAAPNSGLPGTYKLGFWYDTGTFLDQEFDAGGLKLADPASDGVPAEHRGNYSIYAVADQTIWQPDPAGARALSFFTRIMGAPQGDRNLIDLAVNAGLTLKAPFKGRDGDTAGLAVGYTKVSDGVADADRDAGAPVQTSEKYMELTYQYQVANWWIVQPDFQYVFNTGGGVLNPDGSGQKLGDEAVFAVRTTINF